MADHTAAPHTHRPSHVRRGAPCWACLCLWAAVALALTAYIVSEHRDFAVAPDSPSYMQPAISMLQGEGFTNAAGEPEIFRTPGYSVFLAALYAVFGPSLWPVCAAQHALVLAMALGAGAVARRMAQQANLRAGPAQERLASSTACCAVLTCPVLVLFSATVLTEIVFAAVFFLVLVLLASSVERNSPTCAFAGMAALLCATFIRPLALYLPVILIPVLMLYGLRLGRKRMLAGLALGAVLYVVGVGGWMHRNEAAAGYPGFASVQETNLYEYIAASIEARVQGRSWADVRQEYEQKALEIQPAELHDYMRRHAVHVILSRPVEAGKVWLRGALVMFFQPATGHLATLFGLRQSESGIIYKFVSMPLREFAAYAWREDRALVLFLALGLAWLAPFWSLAIAGTVWAVRRPAPFTILALLMAGYVVLVSSGPQSVERFRAPLIPVAAVFAGTGVSRMALKAQERLQLRES